MTIVWRVICRTVFCAVLYTTIIHNGMYTHMSSVYRCPSVYRFNFCAFCVYFLNTVSLFVLGLVFLSCCVSYVCEIQHNEWQNVLLGLSPSPQKGWLYTMALSFCLSVRFFVCQFVCSSVAKAYWSGIGLTAQHPTGTLRPVAAGLIVSATWAVLTCYNINFIP